MSKLFIIGEGDYLKQAELAWADFYDPADIATHEMARTDWVSWDTAMLDAYPSETHKCFVAYGTHPLNMARLRLMSDIKQKGYKLETYISPRASVAADATIGENSFVSDGAVIGGGAIIPFNCYIGPRVIVGPGSKLGHSVWLDAGTITGPRVQIGHNTTLGIGITIREECKIGHQCEITKVMDITQDIPNRTFYHPMFETEVRIFKG
jgi:NDP-sugar pyrophosphorylase family protein